MRKLQNKMGGEMFLLTAGKKYSTGRCKYRIKIQAIKIFIVAYILDHQNESKYKLYGMIRIKNHFTIRSTCSDHLDKISGN